MSAVPEPSHERTTNGVGPHPEPWPDDPRLDPELLATGDTRNVVDRFRYWSMDAIVAELDTHRHAFDVAIENWQHDLNIGSIVRSANAFLAGTVHIVGRRRWNKRGAMVTDRYQHVRYHPDVAAFLEAMRDEGRPVIAIDNTPGASRIETAPIPERCVFLFGQEGPGLTDEAVAGADGHLEITQFGSTRSINASAAAAIVMHSWVVQHAATDCTSGADGSAL
ncbi:rRNA methyltransferase [Curtobacterium sp. MCBA15_016]|uniref:TrmH family RNA methyltransferase n=1 Tax=Curtobacterium sp. MCBA15_016 TaxID=1898740 RepID=UPI0008DE4906|nr:TrmH family RNA methyltransferase [Curtobacterium sp. MCBA15_016]OII28399.1 rRNA methyltransferase [Curtobacterium sp. MCBA15_016]